jgi:hypothetical protein
VKCNSTKNMIFIIFLVEKTYNYRMGTSEGLGSVPPGSSPELDLPSLVPGSSSPSVEPAVYPRLVSSASRQGLEHSDPGGPSRPPSRRERWG